MVQSLAKGWFLSKFEKAKDVEWVLKISWSIDSTSILLKKWTPLFDANKEWM